MPPTSIEGDFFSFDIPEEEEEEEEEEEDDDDDVADNDDGPLEEEHEVEELLFDVSESNSLRSFFVEDFIRIHSPRVSVWTP